MGLLDMLTGNENTLGDRDIASDMLKDSKFSVLSMAEAITELQNSELRQLFRNKLITGMQQHYALSDLVVRKGWYHPEATPERQLTEDVRLAQSVQQANE